jgi:chitin disaccharide deacetylase
MARSLIVNADDFGISAGVTRGILETHFNGIVTSTSVMVNLSHSAESIRLAQREAPKLGLGLHINLSFGKPVLASVPTLLQTADSFCQTYDDLIAMIPAFNSEQVKVEVRAQFDRFTDLAGCLPDHLDSHHGVTEFCAAAGEAMVELAAQYNLPVRRHSFAHSLRQPAVIETGFYWETATLETLVGILRSLPAGITELMCHPGYAEDLDEVYSAPRENELRVLTAPSLKTLIAEQGIRLINFGDV